MSEEQGSRMKTLGLLGGMSWESTALYYKVINETVRAKLGGFHSAKLILYSVDFHDIEQLQQEDRWEEAGALLAGAAHQIEQTGAELLVLCTNTMHEVAGTIERGVKIPLLHIADATAQEIRESGMAFSEHALPWSEISIAVAY
jgi:aspartate racemase